MQNDEFFGEQAAGRPRGSASEIIAEFNARDFIFPISDKLISLLLPGYFIYDRLPSNLQNTLKLAWVTQLISQTANCLTAIDLTSLTKNALKGDFSSPLIFTGLLQLIKYFKNLAMQEVVVLEHVETNLARLASEKLLTSIQQVPEMRTTMAEHEYTIPFHTKTVISQQLTVNYSSLLSCSKLYKDGYYGKIMLGTLLLRCAYIFLNDMPRSHINEHLFNFMNNVKNWFEENTAGSDISGRMDYYLDLINENLEGFIKSVDSYAPGLARWIPYIPFETIVCGVKIFRNINKSNASTEEDKQEDKKKELAKIIGFTLIGIEMANLTTKSKKTIKAMDDLDKIFKFACYAQEKFPYDIVPESYFNMPPHIRLLNIRQSFNNTLLYESQVIDLTPGRIWLNGNNGFGKSFTLRSIEGRQRPTQGGFLVCGRDISYVSPKDRDKIITYIPQSFRFHNTKPILYNLLLWLGHSLYSQESMRAIKRCNTADEILRLNPNRDITDNLLTLATSFGVQDLLSRDNSEISGGEKKLLILTVAIMRARYISTMKIILLDEVTSEVDAENTNLMKQALQYPCFQDKIVIVTTHNCRLFEFDNPISYDKRYDIADKKIIEVSAEP